MPHRSKARESKRDDTLAADEGTAGKRLESDLARYHAAPAKGARKKAEGDISKHALTDGEKLTKGRPRS